MGNMHIILNYFIFYSVDQDLHFSSKKNLWDNLNRTVVGIFPLATVLLVLQKTIFTLKIILVSYNFINSHILKQF